MVSELSKRSLQWQCRRGMKEIEVLLNPFLEDHFERLSPEDQALFARLLECPDSDLFNWFLKRGAPEDGELARMIDVVQSSVAPSL